MKSAFRSVLNDLSAESFFAFCDTTARKKGKLTYHKQTFSRFEYVHGDYKIVLIHSYRSGRTAQVKAQMWTEFDSRRCRWDGQKLEALWTPKAGAKWTSDHSEDYHKVARLFSR